MRSATSFFNATLYKKNLSRFWPLWVAWLVLWAFVLPLNLINQWGNYSTDGMNGLYRFYRTCLNLNNNTGETGLLLGTVFAVLCVMAVYGYLFNHRAAATMHALPLRRETLFITNYLSGVTFFLLPNVLAYGAAALVELTILPAELSSVSMGCLWSGFWVKTGCELFFYSFAVFCAQFTGNVLALPAFYGILNVLVAGMYALCTSLADEIFYGGWGAYTEPLWVKLLTPFYMLYEAVRWDYISWDQIWNTKDNVPLFQELELGFENPRMIAGYAAAGIVLAVLALLIYRRRNIETAGDVVSVKLVRPIFRAGVAVCVGLCGGIVMTAFFGWLDEGVPMTISVLLWTLVGFFAAEMLLQKSFRVFKKSWKSALTTAAAMALLIVVCYMDVFGVETWVPNAAEVGTVNISINNTYPYDEASYLNLDLEEDVGVERIINLHQSIIDDYQAHGEGYYGDDLMHITLFYQMENGAAYRKTYNMVNIIQNEIETPETTTYQIHQFVNDDAVVERVYGLDKARRGEIVAAELQNVSCGKGRFGEVQLEAGTEELWEAVQADFAAGNLGQRYLFDDEVRRTQTYYTDLRLYFLLPREDLMDGEFYPEMVEEEYVHTQESASGYRWNYTMTVTLTPKAQRTLAVLEEHSELGITYDIATHDDRYN